MPWTVKKSDDGVVVIHDNGLPVFVDDDGTENTFDPNQMRSKILDLNSESKKRREENKQLKDQMSLFEGVEDLATYRDQAEEAIRTVKNLKDKDLVKAGEVDKLKSEMKITFEEQEKKLKEQFSVREADLLSQVGHKDSAIRTLMVSNQFAMSPLFGGEDPKTTLPPDIAETYFGRYFEVQSEDGKLQLIAKDDRGEPIYSRQNVGEFATFNEAIEIIFDRYPGRDKLLRSKGGGSGGAGGQGGVTQQTPIANLKAQYDQAVTEGNFTKQIALKNKLHEAMKEQLK